MMRQAILQKIEEILCQNSYRFQSFAEANNSFDLIARRQNLVLILKVLSNIDALRIEHARDLKKLAHVFHAHSLVIGEKSKVFNLKDDVVYERYELPALSIQAFESLLASNFPLSRSYKGQQVVELDFEKLRKLRKLEGLTLKQLSEAAGISLETLHRYEHGLPAQFEVAQKLERILNNSLVKSINLFAYTLEIASTAETERTEDTALEQLRDLGLKLSVFERATVSAAGIEHPLLISHVKENQNPAKKTLLLEKTQRVINQPGLILSSTKKTFHHPHLPVLDVNEITTFSSVHDILNAVHEHTARNAHEKRKKSK